MSENLKRRSAAEIVQICCDMQPGDCIIFEEGNIQVNRFENNFRIFAYGEMHYSAKAINLRPHIQKAIKRKKEMEKFLEEQKK